MPDVAERYSGLILPNAIPDLSDFRRQRLLEGVNGEVSSLANHPSSAFIGRLNRSRLQVRLIVYSGTIYSRQLTCLLRKKPVCSHWESPQNWRCRYLLDIRYSLALRCHG